MCMLAYKIMSFIVRTHELLNLFSQREIHDVFHEMWVYTDLPIQQIITEGMPWTPPNAKWTAQELGWLTSWKLQYVMK